MEKVPIRISKRSKKSIFTNHFFSILVGLVFSGVFCTGVYVFATVNLGTLNPSCSPSDPSCTTPAPFVAGLVNSQDFLQDPMSY